MNTAPVITLDQIAHALSAQPVAVYLASLADGPGRVSTASTLRLVADILGQGDVLTTPWHQLRFQHVAALRSKLAEACAPATVNKAPAAVRGVLKAAWRLGLMDTEACTRAADIQNVECSGSSPRARGTRPGIRFPATLYDFITSRVTLTPHRSPRSPTRFPLSGHDSEGSRGLPEDVRG